MPSPSCIGSNLIDFIYDHAGVRKIKSAATPTIYPNQYYTDFGGGSGNQFKHIFIGSERILTKKTRIAPDREHRYYHPDHLGSTAVVTNERSQLVDALHYFPFGEVWLEERPSSLPTDYFFTAKEFDPETGFYNFGARYLDPRFSKWMTADPALGDYLHGTVGGPYVPSNIALYSYGRNNPATLRDPDGRFVPILLGLAVAGAYFMSTGPANAPGPTSEIQTQSDAAMLGNMTVGATLPLAGPIYGGVRGVAGQAFVRAPKAVTTLTELTAAAADVPVPVTAGATAVGGTVVAGSSFRSRAGQFLENAWEGAKNGWQNIRVAIRGCADSFAESTPVATSEGLKPIGDLKTGDRVLARSEETGAYAFEPITQVFRHQDPMKVHLTLEDPATGATEVIETTPEHPFHVPGRGFVPAGSLKPDDAVSRADAGSSSVVRLIFDQSGTLEVLRVKNLTYDNQPFLAYNLEVGEDHTFFVGTIRAWVHNGCGNFVSATTQRMKARVEIKDGIANIDFIANRATSLSRADINALKEELAAEGVTHVVVKIGPIAEPSGQLLRILTNMANTGRTWAGLTVYSTGNPNSAFILYGSIAK